MKRRWNVRAGACLALVSAIGVVGTLGVARANFHLMVIEEVFAGRSGATNAQFIELQMTSSGQNQLAGHSVTVYGPTGASSTTVTFPSAVANGSQRASVLIATTAAESLFGVTADLRMGSLITPSGGKACFESVDCVSWGSFSGSSSGSGSPFNPGEGIVGGSSMIRSSVPYGSYNQDGDTGNSSADFRHGLPSPRNNAGAVGARDCDIAFTSRSLTARESDGSVAVPIQGCPGAKVSYATIAGTATPGSDFQSSSGTVTFAGTSAEISVPLTADQVAEPPETFSVRIRGVIGGFLDARDALVSVVEPVPPGPPTSVSAEPSGAIGSILVTWGLPATDGGLPISAFTVYERATGGQFVMVAVLAGNARALPLRDRTPLLRYDYQVTASNPAGEGIPSAVACTRPSPFVNVTGCAV